ncbi:MAG: 3-deoxy-D-manno-octulosonate 8-phosphate phosphatase (KDO 8-P phosphatase) [Pseudohongiellaceae bacterium]
MTQLDDLVLIVLDVDGVLTDGRVMLGAGDEELKAFHTRDGAGLALWRDAGFHCTFLTGRGGAAVRRRASELRIERIWEKVRDKSAAYDEILSHFNVEPHQVAVMGDDLPDLSILRRAGFATCPADAARDVLERVHWTAPSRGGHGAVRDLVEHILRGRGAWDDLVERLV